MGVEGDGGYFPLVSVEEDVLNMLQNVGMHEEVGIDLLDMMLFPTLYI